MQKQKKGFWLFIFSLIPGAGEMYMGFKKQGISIMLLFYSMWALAAGTGMDWIIFFFPIIWFYSFFNVHNLSSLSEEEFYCLEDNYVLHLDEFLGSTDTLLTKYRLVIAVLMLTFGVSILWNGISDVLYWILPTPLANLMRSAGYMLPQIVLAVCIILGGIYLLKDKGAEKADNSNDLKEEHFWQPYRPHMSAADDFNNVKQAPAANPGSESPLEMPAEQTPSEETSDHTDISSVETAQAPEKTPGLEPAPVTETNTQPGAEPQETPAGAETSEIK